MNATLLVPVAVTVGVPTDAGVVAMPIARESAGVWMTGMLAVTVREAMAPPFALAVAVLVRAVPASISAWVTV